MYTYWEANLTVVITTLLMICVVVFIHYEGLSYLAKGLSHREGNRRRKVLYGIFGVLSLHVIEIWLFGLAFWLLLLWPATGAIVGHSQLSILDAIYLSSTTYTTVGYGDLAPMGPIRFLAGTEALVGFVLITWSASFTYLEMERYWRR